MRLKNTKEFYEALCNSTVNKTDSDVDNTSPDEDKSSAETKAPGHKKGVRLGIVGTIGSFILVLILRKRLVAYKKERRSNSN